MCSENVPLDILAIVLLLATLQIQDATQFSHMIRGWHSHLLAPCTPGSLHTSVIIKPTLSILT
jgi:hypothetical protein